MLKNDLIMDSSVTSLSQAKAANVYQFPLVKSGVFLCLSLYDCKLDIFGGIELLA